MPLCYRIEGYHKRSSDHPKLEGALDGWSAEERPVRGGKSWEMVEIKSKEGLNKRGRSDQARIVDENP